MDALFTAPAGGIGRNAVPRIGIVLLPFSRTGVVDTLGAQATRGRGLVPTRRSHRRTTAHGVRIPVTDKELAARCRRNYREAQRVLYERCGDRIYRLLLRMTHNADDAADLAQDTFIRAYERIGTFGGTSSLTTWVYRIAVNEALQFLRRRRTRDRAAIRVSEDVPPAAPDARIDTKLDVTDALTRIPDDDRALLVLRYVEGLSYNEMAEVVNKPPGTIASGLNRARQLLRDAMKEASGPAK